MDEFQFLYLTLLIQQLGSPLLLSNIINYLRIYLSIHYNGREINFVNTLCASISNLQQNQLLNIFDEGFDACGVYIFYEGSPEDEFQFLPLTLLIQQLGSPLLLSNIINYLRTYLRIHYNGREINFVNTLCASISNLQQNQLLTIFDVYISIFIRNPALIQSCEYDLPYQLRIYYTSSSFY